MESIKSFLQQWDLLGLVIAAIISLIVGLCSSFALPSFGRTEREFYFSLKERNNNKRESLFL